MARLARQFDFDVAEEAVQQAILEAITAWRRDGPPERPGAWLQVAARRNALDAVRRGQRQHDLAQRLPRARARSRHRRTAAAALRVLPPGPRPRGPARAHPARRGRPDHPADRAGLPRQRGHARPADRAGQAQDRGGGDLAERARRRRAGRARRRRPVRGLRDVQRGVRLLDRPHPGPRPRCGRGLARRCRRDRDAASRRGVGARGAADPPTRPRRRPVRRRRRPGAAARPGPVAAGTDAAISAGETRCSSAPRPARPGPLPAPGRHRRLPRHQPVVGGDRLAADRHALRAVARARPLARWCCSTERSRWPSSDPSRPPARSPRSRRWRTRSRRTTSSTPPAPSCSAGSAATRRRPSPTSRPWPSPTTRPSDGCSRRGCAVIPLTDGS